MKMFIKLKTNTKENDLFEKFEKNEFEKKMKMLSYLQNLKKMKKEINKNKRK